MESIGDKGITHGDLGLYKDDCRCSFYSCWKAIATFHFLLSDHYYYCYTLSLSFSLFLTRLLENQTELFSVQSMNQEKRTSNSLSVTSKSQQRHCYYYNNYIPSKALLETMKTVSTFALVAFTSSLVQILASPVPDISSTSNSTISTNSSAAANE